MTTTLRAKFDGKLLVPEGAVDLPIGPTLTFVLDETVSPVETETAVAPAKTGLQRLAELAEQFEADPGWPPDGAAQHDHYLYGTPKREDA